MKTTARLLIVIAVLFLVALIGRGTAEGKQAEAGNPEPKVEAAPEMVPRAWWLAERRKRKRLARYSVKIEKARNALKRELGKRFYPVSYAIRLAATTYGVSEWQMHRVASCESGHSAFATNGQYRGVFQEGPMFESGPFGHAGFSVFDPVANSMTAAYTVARQGWRQWSCRP
jgi:hypothetical protein